MSICTVTKCLCPNQSCSQVLMFLLFGLCLCLQHVSHAQITLTFHYPGETIAVFKKIKSSRAKILMRLWGKWLQIWARGWKWELWGEWARRRGEDITCKGLWGAWAHNQWSEVCVVSVASSRLHRSQSYFYREDRSVAMLFEKVSCSLKKTGSINSVGRITPQEWTEGKRAVEMRGAASARWHIQLIIDDLIHYTLKGTCWHQQK